MKKILLVAAITGMFVQGVWAKSDQQIRDEAKNNVITVSQVSGMTEGTGVTLNGQIVKQLAAEEDHLNSVMHQEVLSLMSMMKYGARWP